MSYTPSAAEFGAVEDIQRSEDMVYNLKCILQQIWPDNDVWDDSVEDTARRIINFWYEYSPPHSLNFRPTTFAASVNQLIAVTDIEFSSLCAHHLLPYYGKAHVGYVPNKLMIGLSKIPRLVRYFASRPSVQETLTANTAKWLKDHLAAHGVAVIVEARHTCMSCRGIRAHNALMRTSEMRGIFLTAGEARSEFLSMIGRENI